MSREEVRVMMKTQKAKETSQAIVKATYELCKNKNIGKITVSEIAKKAGVAKGTFYLYFETKDDAIWAAIENDLGHINAQLKCFAALDCSEETIIHIVDYIISHLKKNEVILKVMHHINFLNYFGKEKTQIKCITQWTEPVEIWLERGVEAGKIHTQNTNLLSNFIVIAIYEILDGKITGKLPYTYEELREGLKEILMKLLK